MDKKSRNTIIISIIALAIVLITVTYAYFSARITGIESASTISLTAGHMGIVYTEGNENVTLTNIYPREEAWVTKTFTLTGYNTTEANMKYDLGLNVITNTFTDGYLTYDLRMVSSTNGTPIATKTNMPINGTGTIRFGTGTFTNADGDTHNYELKIYFKDNGLDQNDSQGAVFNANISVTEQGGLTPVNNYTYDGEVTNGTSITSNDGNGLYEYRYNQEGCISSGYGGCSVSANNNKPQLKLLHRDIWSNTNGWNTFNTNGWGVRLRDYSLTSPVTEKLYTSINNEPITSMAYMFLDSSTSSIDLSSFDTSNVVDMKGLFMQTYDVTSLDLSSFNTSNVMDMSNMFKGSAATTLDLSSFDTSNVTYMGGMFENSYATSINLSSFDTSHVTNMAYMFKYSKVSTLDLSNFDISNVERMDGMLSSSYITTVYARTETEANRYCAAAMSNTSIYVGSNLVCHGTYVHTLE